MHQRGGVMDLLEAEAGSGFRRLAGARLAGTVPLSETVLNDWLARVPQLPAGLAVAVHGANRLVVRHGVVQATLVLDEEVRLGEGGARVGLRVRSVVVALVLRAAIQHPAVRWSGQHVTIDLGAAADRYRHYWTHLQRLTLRTSPGRLHVTFDVAIDDAARGRDLGR